MVAAIRAAEAGRGRVVLVEGNQELGRKILISGNGRCNLANVDGDDPGHYHGGHPHFVRPALAAFPVAQTLQFFADLGIEVRQEKRGRLFPRSDQARSVVDLLADRLSVLGVDVRCGVRVDRLDAVAGGFCVGRSSGPLWEAERVVLCSGGISVPKLGADDSGIRLAAALGHGSTPLYPGLVALDSPDTYVRRMQGVKVWARVQARLGPAEVADTDDLLFARYGVSGFSILNLSAVLVRQLREVGPLTLTVSLMPEWTAEQVSEMLKARWERHPHRGLALSLAGLLHDKVARPLLEKVGLDPARPAGETGKRERWALARVLTAWPIEVTGPRDFEYAEVTIGGIRADEVDPHTLESYVVPGLYLAGEMLDVHGDLGGYNLQWAWSSGHVAGQTR